MSNALSRSLASLLLVVAASASAAPVVRHVVSERSPEARDVQVLMQARSTFVDRNGTSWIYHGVTGVQHDPMAAAVTAIRPDGSTRTYLATDILPPRSVMPGKVGQVFAITPLTTPGAFAATAGWLDPDGMTRNAVVFFRERSDGTLSNDSVVPAPGARAIAAGPHDSAVVAAVDPLRNGDTALATIINANGTVTATYGTFETSSIGEANDRIAGVRFFQLDTDAVALLDASAQRVHAFRIFVPENCGIEKITLSERPRAMAMGSDKVLFAVNDLWTVPVSDTSDSGADEVFAVTGFAATKEGVVTVVRPIVVDERPRTLVTRYTTRGRERSWSSDHFWRATLVTPVEARGILQKETPWEERVSLAE